MSHLPAADYRIVNIGIAEVLSGHLQFTFWLQSSAVADEDDLLGVRFVPRYSGVRTIHRSPRSYWQPYVPLKLRNRVKFPLSRNYVAFPPTRAYIRRGTFNG